MMIVHSFRGLPKVIQILQSKVAFWAQTGIRVYDQNIVFLCLILYINPILIHRAPIWYLPAIFLYLRHDFHSDSGNRVKFVTEENI